MALPPEPENCAATCSERSRVRAAMMTFVGFGESPGESLPQTRVAAGHHADLAGQVEGVENGHLASPWFSESGHWGVTPQCPLVFALRTELQKRS